MSLDGVIIFANFVGKHDENSNKITTFMSTRRDFLKGVSLATAGMTLNPAGVFAMTSKETKQAKSEKVKIAYIGIGNRGQQNIDEFAKTNMVDVVALCDVDLNGKKFKKLMNYADKIKVPKMAIVGSNDLAEGKITIKDMVSGQQELVDLDNIVSFIKGE